MHFLSKYVNPHRPIVLWKPWAAVEIVVKGKELQIQPGIRVAKGDVRWLELPPGFKVKGEAGEEIRPDKGKRWLVSSETFDPCHLLAEVL